MAASVPVSSPFNIVTRAAELADAAETELDVLVVGMGATGAGVALDAASRGLRVAVVDKGDLASGTSIKSNKLVHGGLRYLENAAYAERRTPRTRRARSDRRAGRHGPRGGRLRSAG